MAVPLRVRDHLRLEAPPVLDDRRWRTDARVCRGPVDNVDLKLIGRAPRSQHNESHQKAEDYPLAARLLLWAERREDSLGVLALYLGIDVGGVVGLFFAQRAFTPL